LKIRGYLGSVNQILARQAGYVGAGASDVFALNNGYPFAVQAQVPGHRLSGLSTAQYNGIESFNIGHGVAPVTPLLAAIRFPEKCIPPNLRKAAAYDLVTACAEFALIAATDENSMTAPAKREIKARFTRPCLSKCIHKE
jgi:hypothetical protein